jgi:hypothetical protein
MKKCNIIVCLETMMRARVYVATILRGIYAERTIIIGPFGGDGFDENGKHRIHTATSVRDSMAMKQETTMWASACDGPQHDAGDEGARALDYGNGNRNSGTGRGGEGTFGTCGDSKRRGRLLTVLDTE